MEPNQFIGQKKAPIEKFNLYGGMTNWCGCDDGPLDMEKEVSIKHISDQHDGLIVILQGFI